MARLLRRPATRKGLRLGARLEKQEPYGLGATWRPRALHAAYVVPAVWYKLVSITEPDTACTTVSPRK